MKTLFDNTIWHFFLGLVLFFIFFFFQILLGFIFLIPNWSATLSSEQLEALVIPFSGYIFILSTFVPFLIIYLFIRLKKMSFVDFFQLYLPKKQTILLYLHYFILFILFIECVGLYLPGLLEEPFSEMVFSNAHSRFVLFLSVVLFAPVFEELIFRALMFNGLKEKFGVVAAIFIPAIIFALAHWGQYSFWICFLAVFPMGVLFGYARLKSNTLTLPIALHLVNNLMAFLFLYFEFY